MHGGSKNILDPWISLWLTGQPAQKKVHSTRRPLIFSRHFLDSIPGLTHLLPNHNLYRYRLKVT